MSGPSEELSYVHGCAGKRSYTSKAAAKRAVKTTLTRSGVIRTPGRGPLKVYRCRHCDRWHFGHPLLRRTG